MGDPRHSSAEQRSAPERAELCERRLGPFPWIVVRGPRREAFEALGAHAAASVRALLAELPDVVALRARVAGDGALRERLAAVREASRREHPAAWGDLEALAAGAGLELDELVLLNLRGDLGRPAGAGCSDLSWSDGARALVAHNEDDLPLMGEHYRLLTLCIEDEPTVTAWWAPGFLPANTWATNEFGLLYTVDHLAIADPLDAPGRHFVARGMQRATSVAEALEWLREHPSAGGFTFTLAQVGDPDVVVVEIGAGRCAAVVVEHSAAPRWHANHARYLPAGLDRPSAESLARGERLERLASRANPDIGSLLAILRTPAPDGVCRDASDGDELATHCSVVADLAAGEVTITRAGRDGVTLPLAALGEPACDSATANV